MAQRGELTDGLRPDAQWSVATSDAEQSSVALDGEKDALVRANGLAPQGDNFSNI